MFKQAYFYKCDFAKAMSTSDVESVLKEKAFGIRSENDHTDRGGFIPPLSNSESLTHGSQGRTLFRFFSEKKVIPPYEVNQLLEKKIEKINLEENRRVGKLEEEQLKQECIAYLRPRAFFKSQDHYGFFDHNHGVMVLDCNACMSDLLSSSLRKIFKKYLTEDFKIDPILNDDGKYILEKQLMNWLSAPSLMPDAFELGHKLKFLGTEGETVNVSIKEEKLPAYIAENLSIVRKIEAMQVYYALPGGSSSVPFKVNEKFHLSSIKHAHECKRFEGDEDSLDSDFVLHTGTVMEIYEKIWGSIKEEVLEKEEE